MRDHRGDLARVTANTEFPAWSKAEDTEAARSPLFVEDIALAGWRFLLKDAIERSVAVLALILGLPVLAAVWVAVRVGDGRPVLFYQQRVGLHGQPFRLIKFRTLSYASDSADESIRLVRVSANGWTLEAVRDPRLTRVGAFLRRTGLDELPQLWNIVRGDMALVGPRPRFFRELESWDSEDRRLLLVKPGLTGLAEVTAVETGRRGAVSPLDHYYVDHWSPAIDVYVLLRTIAFVFRGRDSLGF